MSVPEIYLCQSVSLAKRIREGKIEPSQSALESYLGRNYKPGISDRIICVALKLVKYPDISRAAWSADYRKQIDGAVKKKCTSV